MNLIEEFNKLQDTFKDAIMNEPDLEKQNDLIKSNTSKSDALMVSIANELFEKDKELIEVIEDDTNTNDNHPLVNTFEKMVRKRDAAETIAKQFKESELIEIGKEFGLKFSTLGTKTEKVKLIIEKIK